MSQASAKGKSKGSKANARQSSGSSASAVTEDMRSAVSGHPFWGIGLMRLSSPSSKATYKTFGTRSTMTATKTFASSLGQGPLRHLARI
jgi:hypothetical protein